MCILLRECLFLILSWLPCVFLFGSSCLSLLRPCPCSSCLSYMCILFRLLVPRCTLSHPQLLVVSFLIQLFILVSVSAVSIFFLPPQPLSLKLKLKYFGVQKHLVFTWDLPYYAKHDKIRGYFLNKPL